jgi:hypothetical protein
VGSRGRGRLEEDANPNSDWTDDRFLRLYCFFIGVFFVLGRFIDLVHLETNEVHRRKEDLRKPIYLANSIIRMDTYQPDRVSVHNFDNHLA